MTDRDSHQKIKLREIDEKNFGQCISLNTSVKQKEFVATNEYSLAQCYILEKFEGKKVFPLGIYADEEMIGFALVVFHLDIEELELSVPTYEIVRFMLDERFQGKGYGKVAFGKIIDFIKTSPSGQGKYVALSCVIGNEVAEKLYLSFGFENTKYVFDDEREMLLKL